MHRDENLLIEGWNTNESKFLRAIFFTFLRGGGHFRQSGGGIFANCPFKKWKVPFGITVGKILTNWCFLVRFPIVKGGLMSRYLFPSIKRDHLTFKSRTKVLTRLIILIDNFFCKYSVEGWIFWEVAEYTPTITKVPLSRMIFMIIGIKVNIFRCFLFLKFEVSLLSFELIFGWIYYCNKIKTRLFIKIRDDFAFEIKGVFISLWN